MSWGISFPIAARLQGDMATYVILQALKRQRDSGFLGLPSYRYVYIDTSWYFMIFHAKKGAAKQAEIIGQIDLTGRLWKWGIVKQYVYHSRSRTSIWCTHLLKCSSMISFIGGNIGKPTIQWLLKAINGNQNRIPTHNWNNPNFYIYVLI